MKRSEILGIIRDAFDDCLDIPTSSYIIIDNYEEYILSKIEAEGMLPPLTKKEIMVRANSHYDNGDEYKRTIEINVWDEE